MREENSGEDGLLVEVIDGEGDRQKISANALKVRLKEIGNDPLYADEQVTLRMYGELLQQHSSVKAKRKTAQVDLDKKIDAKYPKLTEAEIKTLVVDKKWMEHLSASVQIEIERVSRALDGRVRQLSDRYRTPLPELEGRVGEFAAKVEGHLKRMGLAGK